MQEKNLNKVFPKNFISDTINIDFNQDSINLPKLLSNYFDNKNIIHYFNIINNNDYKNLLEIYKKIISNNLILDKIVKEILSKNPTDQFIFNIDYDYRNITMYINDNNIKEIIKSNSNIMRKIIKEFFNDIDKFFQEKISKKFTDFNNIEKIFTLIFIYKKINDFERKIYYAFTDYRDDDLKFLKKVEEVFFTRKLKNYDEADFEDIFFKINLINGLIYRFIKNTIIFYLFFKKEKDEQVIYLEEVNDILLNILKEKKINSLKSKNFEKEKFEALRIFLVVFSHLNFIKFKSSHHMTSLDKNEYCLFRRQYITSSNSTFVIDSLIEINPNFNVKKQFFIKEILLEFFTKDLYDSFINQENDLTYIIMFKKLEKNIKNNSWTQSQVKLFFKNLKRSVIEKLRNNHYSDEDYNLENLKKLNFKTDINLKILSRYIDIINLFIDNTKISQKMFKNFLINYKLLMRGHVNIILYFNFYLNMLFHKKFKEKDNLLYFNHRYIDLYLGFYHSKFNLNLFKNFNQEFEEYLNDLNQFVKKPNFEKISDQSFYFISAKFLRSTKQFFFEDMKNSSVSRDENIIYLKNKDLTSRQLFNLIIQYHSFKNIMKKRKLRDKLKEMNLIDQKSMNESRVYYEKIKKNDGYKYFLEYVYVTEPENTKEIDKILNTIFKNSENFKEIEKIRDIEKQFEDIILSFQIQEIEKKIENYRDHQYYEFYQILKNE